MPVTVSALFGGARELAEQLLGVPEFVRIGLEQVAQTMRTLVVGRTPVKSGAAKRSWGQIEQTAHGFSFRSSSSYMHILDEGLYLRAGPRTIEQQGRIYSKQAPGGIVSHYMQDAATIDSVAETVLNQIVKGFEQYA